MADRIVEKTKDVRFHCCDLSAHAISLVQSHPSFSPSRVHPFVHDLCASSPPGRLVDRLKEAEEGFGRLGDDEAGRVDVVSCVFVLSAIPPEKHGVAVDRMVEVRCRIVAWSAFPDPVVAGTQTRWLDPLP